MRNRTGTLRWGAALAVLAAAGLLAACTAPPTGGGGGPVTTTTVPFDDEPFTIAFIADPEARMRGNTDAEITAYVENLIAFRTTRVRHFDHDGGRHRVDPELVVLGGDISADRDTSIATDLPLYRQLYDAGIGFIAGFGNHDWDPAQFSDGPGYSVAGHLSNEDTKAFTRETYRLTDQLLPEFTYREFGPSSTFGPMTFLSTYKGVDIVNLGSYLYQPSYYYPEGWPVSCNLLGGGAGCQIFVSAENQIDRLAAALGPDPTRPTLFMQHYPLTTGDSWWDDHGASGTTVAQKKARLLGLMDRFDHTALLAGHNHIPATFTHGVGGRTFTEYVAPYFGGSGGDDPTRGGGFLALLVSPSQGILEADFVPGPG